MADPAAPASVGNFPNDILFQCDYCGASLVVDRAACGLTLNCQRCGQAVRVPSLINSPPSPAATKEVIADLNRQLKENASQRTEVIGYINQLSIQLHRWQHRLKVLNERQVHLEAQIQDATRDLS